VGGSVEECSAAEVVAPPEEQDVLPEKQEVEVAEASTESAVSENPEASTEPSTSETPLMWDDWGNRIEVWSNVKKIADSAVGRALSAAALSEDKSLDATVVPWNYVQSAWLARKSLRDQKRSWLKDAGSLSTQDLEEAKASADEPTTDEVVERIRNDNDLDPYEQRLLGCIVDSGMSMPRILPFSNTNTVHSFHANFFQSRPFTTSYHRLSSNDCFSASSPPARLPDWHSEATQYDWLLVVWSSWYRKDVGCPSPCKGSWLSHAGYHPFGHHGHGKCLMLISDDLRLNVL
jgi:hypothetical protein